MLITTSRRPDHLARILCRELVRVIPRSRYVPRGAKTVEGIVSIARKLAHDRIMLVNSASGEPKELRFLEVGDKWKWSDAKIELGSIKLQRDIGRKFELKDLTIFAEGTRATKFAEWVGKLLGVGCSDKLPGSGGIASITSEDGLEIKFQVVPGRGEVGPVIEITSFGRLFEE